MLPMIPLLLPLPSRSTYGSLRYAGVMSMTWILRMLPANRAPNTQKRSGKGPGEPNFWGFRVSHPLGYQEIPSYLTSVTSHALHSLISSLGSPLRGVRWGEGWETCREMSGREVRKRRVTDDQGLGLTVHLVHFPRLSHRVSLSSLTLIVRHLRSRPPSVA